MKIETLLREEIQNELAELNRMELGTEQYKTTVDGLTKLVDRTIELDRLQIDAKDKEATRMDETALKLEQMTDDRKDRFVKNGIAVAGIVIPSVITVWGVLKSLKFEEEGTLTTIVGRGFINKLLPKK